MAMVGHTREVLFLYNLVVSLVFIERCLLSIIPASTIHRI